MMSIATNVQLPRGPVLGGQGRFLGEEAAATWLKVLRQSLVPMLLLACRVAPAPINQASYPLLAIYALFGRRQAILSLFLLFLFNTFTHAFGLPPSIAGLFRHLNVFAAAFSVLVLHFGRPPRSTIPGMLWWTAALSVLLILHSVALSTFPEIAVLKSISFALTIQTLLVAWSSLTPDDRALAEKQIFGCLVAFAVLSVPLIAMPLGYLRQSQFFKGLFVHSQIFGPVMGYLATWIFASWLTTRKTRVLPLALLALVLGLLYLSKARIGLVVLLAGVVASVLAGPFAKAVGRWRDQGRIRAGRLGLALVMLAIFSVALGPKLYDSVNEFIRKGQAAESTLDALTATREFLIDKMLVNIRERPMTGIGFGVPSNLNPADLWGYARDPIFGLPIMAAVEKGVLPVAMVEEMGYPLALLYGLWFAALFWLAMRAGVVPAGICAAALATGAAEANFFAPGGAGLLTMLLTTMAATAGSRHPQAQPYAQRRNDGIRRDAEYPYAA